MAKYRSWKSRRRLHGSTSSSRRRSTDSAIAAALEGTVDEVHEFLTANPEMLSAVQAAEEAGKARKGILSLTAEDLTASA